MASMRQETLGVHFSYMFILEYILYSIMGAFSIVYSAIHRRTVCNPKVLVYLSKTEADKILHLFTVYIYIGAPNIHLVHCGHNAECHVDNRLHGVAGEWF